MSDKPRLKVVLCWHMHQPQYRNLLSHQYQLPWCYLHAIGEYTDMAYFLEAAPGARAVVNFSPILLEQIEDYARQVCEFLNKGEALHDPVLAALAARPNHAFVQDEYTSLIKTCLRVNQTRLVDRFPPYRRLADIAAWLADKPEALFYLNGERYLFDLLVWYHLAWMGETVRREDSRVKQLLEKACGYTYEDRRLLLEIIVELLASVTGRYRALAESGRIELSMTPYAHPLLPLMLDFDCALDAMPEARLPVETYYPGGLERARWHIREGKAAFRRHFGIEPQGCWPAEGGVSMNALRLLGESGFTWAATGEGVLRNTLQRAGTLEGQPREQWFFRPYQVAGTFCFFRDEGLSDLIGFTYSHWHSDDAINNLVHHLENIAAATRDKPDSIVSIIMDGENAWEHYHENAYHFLSRLYKRLADHPQLDLTTFSSYIECRSKATPPAELTELVAGSWVYGSFSTWIGDAAKNRGWELLCEAKRAFDRALQTGRLQGERLIAAERQLAVCEGSDWCWWFGDYNPAATVSDFEQLYRLHLSNLYLLLSEQAPESLTHAVSQGSTEAPQPGAMRRAQEHS